MNTDKSLTVYTGQALTIHAGASRPSTKLPKVWIRVTRQYPDGRIAIDNYHFSKTTAERIFAGMKKLEENGQLQAAETPVRCQCGCKSLTS